MLRSMTTFARLESADEDWSFVLELRSVNSRYCDCNIRLPNWMNALEARIKKVVQEAMVRGRIELRILCRGGRAVGVMFEPDLDVGRSYLDAVGKLEKGLGLEGGVRIADLLAVQKDVIVARDRQHDLDELWGKLAPIMKNLLENAVAMSADEGRTLEQDLSRRLSRVEVWINEIAVRTPESLDLQKQAMFDRIRAIAGDISVDETRLAQEAAVLADRLDITEELVRARSHVEQFRNLLQGREAVGRKLDFMLQEIFREINTMAAKSSDAVISHLVVDIKGELEKMREQVQNVL